MMDIASVGQHRLFPEDREEAELRERTRTGRVVLDLVAVSTKVNCKRLAVHRDMMTRVRIRLFFT